MIERFPETASFFVCFVCRRGADGCDGERRDADRAYRKAKPGHATSLCLAWSYIPRPDSGSKKWSVLVSMATSATSPSRTRERGAEATDDGRLGRALVEIRHGDGIRVLRELPHVLGERWLGVDLQVHHDFRAEGLAQQDGSRQAPVGRRVGHERRVLEMLGPDAEDHRRAEERLERRVRGDGLLVERDRVGPGRRDDAAVGTAQRRLDHVHRGRADEAADEQVDRPVVELLRLGHLLDLALAHDRDPVAHRHRLDLVVGDVDRRDPEVVLQPGDLGAHLHAKLCVEVRERLVHQERLRLPDDRPPHRDPLPLTPRERARLALEERLEVEDMRRFLDAAVDLVLRDFLDAQPEGDVLVDGEVRVQGVALEDHRDVAVARRHVVDDAVADAQRRRQRCPRGLQPSGARSSCRTQTGRRAP